jgi:hypothetical protein
MHDVEILLDVLPGRAPLLVNGPSLERQMREAYRRLLTTEDQVDWNIAFKAFVSSARCLKEFFTDGHSNGKVKEYVKGFKPLSHKLQGVLRDMNQQVEHIAKERAHTTQRTSSVSRRPGRCSSGSKSRLLRSPSCCLVRPTRRTGFRQNLRRVSIDPAAPGASAHPTCSSIFTTRFLSHSESAATHV